MSSSGPASQPAKDPKATPAVGGTATSIGGILPLRTHTPEIGVGPRILKPGIKQQFILDTPDWKTMAEYVSLGSRLEFRPFEDLIPGITAASGRVRAHSLVWRQKVYPAIVSLAVDLTAFARQADVALDHTETFVGEIFQRGSRFGDTARRLAELSLNGLEGRAELLSQHAHSAGKIFRQFHAAQTEDEAAIEPVLAEIEKLNPHDLGVFLAPFRELTAAQPFLRTHFESIQNLRQRMRDVVQLFGAVQEPLDLISSTWKQIHAELTNLRLVVAENSPNPVLRKINYRAARKDWGSVAKLATRFLDLAPR